MVFDPHRHVTVASGAFSVDVNELNAAHAALTYEKLLAIGPSKAALTCAQLEVDLAPFDTSSVTSAINTALSSLDDLGAAVDDLLWKLRDAALTYDDANSFASLWEAVPGSASGPQFSLLGLARFEATGGFAGVLWSAGFHLCQDAAARLGVPGLATVVMPLPAMATHSRDLMNTGIDGLEFWKHED